MAQDKIQYVTANGNSYIDFELGKLCIVNMTGNVTFSFNAKDPDVYILKLKQDATGGRTFTFPSSVKWTDAITPTFSTTANAWDVVTLLWDGQYFSGVLTPNISA